MEHMAERDALRALEGYSNNYSLGLLGANTVLESDAAEHLLDQVKVLKAKPSKGDKEPSFSVIFGTDLDRAERWLRSSDQLEQRAGQSLVDELNLVAGVYDQYPIVSYVGR
jgi:hypothetical protein